MNDVRSCLPEEPHKPKEGSDVLEQGDVTRKRRETDDVDTFDGETVGKQPGLPVGDGHAVSSVTGRESEVENVALGTAPGCLRNDVEHVRRRSNVHGFGVVVYYNNPPYY